VPYIVPTPDDVRSDFPVFASVDDAVIQRRIDRTESTVDESWMESDYTYARSLLAAHYLTEDGVGGGTDAEIAALGLSGVSRLKSGTLDVTFANTNSTGDGAWDNTSYGRRFASILRRNKGGPLIAGADGVGLSGAATDVPWAWKWGGFGL
jgi:hypothetical protein